MNRRYYFPMLIGLFALTAGWVIAEPTADEITENRRRLAELRKNPEQIERLRRDVKSFLELPNQRRERVSKLDNDLHDLPAKEQQRLTNTLQRYADWLDQLRDKDPAAYRAISEAPDAATRLTLIKERRDRDWLEAQPRALRDEWQKKQGAARAEFIGKAREDARRKREQWLIAKRFWSDLEGKKTMPTRLSDFAGDKVKRYVEEYLLPTLTPAEKKQLADAEGSWPDYPQTLVALASKRPSALPPDPPRKIAQLPKPVQTRLTEKKKGGGVKKLDAKNYEGPNLASNLAKHFPTQLSGEFEYLAPNYNSLTKPMRDFVDNKLLPVLDQPEKRKLSDAEKQWPEYPIAIQELARKHDLTPPWHILPEPEK